MLTSELHNLAGGGPVLIPLFICSVMALAVIIERTFVLRSARERVDRADTALKLIRSGKDQEASDLCRRESWLSGRVFAAAIDSRDLGLREVEQAVTSAALSATVRLPQRMGVLDTVITLAPLLGLFGTVTGMIKAFGVIGAGGLANSTRITGGVAESLIATSIGLAIAIVTLIFYNGLNQKLTHLIEHVQTSASEVVAAYALRAGESAVGARSRMKRNQRRPDLKKARIEIIPMIDTIFFLLVFFMMSVLAMVHLTTHKVQLPLSGTAQIKPADVIVVTLAKDSTYFVDEQQVTEAQIEPLVAGKVHVNPAQSVVINCDRAEPLSRFLRIYDIIKQADPSSVLIAAKPDEAGKH